MPDNISIKPRIPDPNPSKDATNITITDENTGRNSVPLSTTNDVSGFSDQVP